MFHVQDEGLWTVLNVAEFVINQCKTFDIPEDFRFVLNDINDKIRLLKARVETKPF